MSAYKHLTDLLKICSVLPALAIMPAVAAGTSNDPNAVGQWSGNEYIEEENVKRGGGVLKLAIGDTTYQNDYIQAGLVSGNSISVTKTGGGVANDVYAQGSVLYSQGSLGGISGTFKNNSVNTSAAERSKASANGGAFALYAGTNIKSISGDFIGNSATSKVDGGKYSDENNQVSAGGGAIHIEAQYGNKPVSIGEIDGDFTSNSANGDAYANGGAIYIKGGSDREGNDGFAVNVGMIDGDFSRNSVTATADKGAFVAEAGMKNSTGGAVSIKEENGAATVTIDGDFEYNTVTTNATNAFGGAIYNEGTLTLEDSDFTYNKAASTSGSSRGGAIYNAATNAKGDTVAGSVTINGDVDIIGNSAGWGGAIYNEGDLTLNTANIYGNKAQISEEGKGKGWGGAIYNTGTLNFNAKSGMSASDRVYVKGNTATHVGGAIYNEGTLNFNNVTDDDIVQITFGENSADYGGGAIYNKGDINTLSRVLFQGNSGGIGAAVLNSTDGTIGSIKNSTFAYNTAQTTGGAVHNKGTIETVENVLFQGNRSNNGGAFWNGSGGEVQFENVDFISNGAVITNAVEEKNNLQGGAISNSGTISYINNSTFVGNQAGKQGGAIANALSGGKGTVVLKDVLMDSNVAGDVGGAIYNHDGIVTLSGNNTFVNNFAGGVANDIHNLGTLNITGGVTTMTGGITGDGGVLTISGGAILDIGTASIQQSSIKFDGEGGTLLASLVNEDHYSKLLVDSIDGNADITLKIGSVGEYDVFGKDGVTGITFNYGNLFNVTTSDDNKVIVTTKDVATVAKDNGLANESAAVLVGLANSGNNAMNAMAIRAQDALKEQGGAQYVQAEAKKLLPQDTPVAQSVASSAQSQVLSLAAGRMSGNALVGRSGGDAANMDYGVWAQGLMNHSKYADKFSGDTYGVAVGADALINGKYTVGIGYAYNETDIDATHDMSIDSSSLFVYGQYKPTQWYINAALNYTMANYEESGVAFDWAFDSYKYDVDSFGGQIMTGYDFASGLTPEVGARYLHIATDDYNNGFNVENEDTNYLTGVAGLKYAFEIESDARLKFRPEIRAAATYDFLSDEAVTTVTIPGASAYVLNGERLSRFGGEFGIGLSALYEGWEISVNYDLDLHEDYTSQTGMLKFRYNF